MFRRPPNLFPAAISPIFLLALCRPLLPPFAIAYSMPPKHPTHLPLSSVLSGCVDASLRGCEVIRSYAPSLAGKGAVAAGSGNVLKEAGDVKSVMTAADIAAQRCILSALRATFGPGLSIVGEEEEDDEEDASYADDVVPLRMDLLPEVPSDDETVALADLTVFVDPLDGTREFVEGRVGNVACLIGVAAGDGRAVAGAVGVPFPGGAVEEERNCAIDTTLPPRTYYGLVGDDAPSSVHGVHPPEAGALDGGFSSGSGDDGDLVVLTGDSSDPVLRGATERALSNVPGCGRARRELVGGTASKLLTTARRDGGNVLSILHFKTSLWDTCATEALLASMGGRVTDHFGSPICHRPGRVGGVGDGNVWGVVASGPGEVASKAHSELCLSARADPVAVGSVLGTWMGSDADSCEGAQAVDVSRDLDGSPLTREWLEQQVGAQSGALRGYSVPDEAAARMMMSNGCRIALDWDGDVPDVPATLFYKRIVMSDLGHARAKLKAAPHKLTRDVRSYQVECNFLTSDACKSLVDEAGVRINRVYGSDLRPVTGTEPREQIQSRFAILLEDFNSAEGWEQEWLLQEDSAREALGVFARMHAYFWNGSEFWTKDGGRLGEEMEHLVWPNGGYMQPQLQGEAQLEKVAEGWTARLPSIIDELKAVPNLEGVDLEGIGERVQRLAKVVGRRAHPFAPGVGESEYYRQYRTFIHGDPKQANIFLRRNGGGGMDVGLIDFQWSGFGLAATDVAHNIAASLHGSCLSKEEELLDHYYASLSEALVEFGAASSKADVEERVFPRSIFQSQYDTAMMDICRMVFAYAWARLKLETEPTAASLNRNSYNKSIENVLWLVSRCSALLEKREDEWLE